MKTLLCILGLFLVGNLIAQDARLFQQEWYLHDLIIDGESNVPPVNSELHHIPLNFDEPDEFRTEVCSGTSCIGTLLFNGTNDFSFENLSCLAGSCNLNTNVMYTNLYQGFWFTWDPGPFHYKITEDGAHLVLIIIASEDNLAIYRTDFLATEEFEDSVFQIYPNPVENQLFMQFSNDVVAETIRIYDLQGRLIHIETPTNTDLIEIDTSSLRTGLYFVTVIDDGGRASTERFVKN